MFPSALNIDFPQEVILNMFPFTNQNPSPNYFSLPGIPLFYLPSITPSHQGQGKEKKKANNNSNQTVCKHYDLGSSIIISTYEIHTLLQF